MSREICHLDLRLSTYDLRPTTYDIKTASSGGGAPVGDDRWYITLNLAAVTSLPAEPGETRAELRARIHRWIDQQREPLGGEGIYLGGK